jgi:hypothetical protein
MWGRQATNCYFCPRNAAIALVFALIMENQTDIKPDTAHLPQNGHSRLTILSSNKTLVWRVFVPVFGTVFLTVLSLAYILTTDDDSYTPFVPAPWAKVLVALLWLGWLYFVYRALWRLHRVDADDTHFYVTNYWTTARYSWDSVASLEEKRRLGRRVVNIHLRAAGRFGKKISFLPGSTYDEWMAQNGKAEGFSAN